MIVSRIIAESKDYTDDAWLLGHAQGAAGLPAVYPAHYNQAQQEAYQDGWRAGDAGRTSSTLMGVPDDCEIAEYLSDRHAGDFGDDDFPDLFVMGTESNDDYYSRLAEDEEPDPWTVEEWERKREATRGREVHQVEVMRYGRIV